jgi:hypothetical protein
MVKKGMEFISPLSMLKWFSGIASPHIIFQLGAQLLNNTCSNWKPFTILPPPICLCKWFEKNCILYVQYKRE